MKPEAAYDLADKNTKMLGVSIEKYKNLVFIDQFGREIWTNALEAAIESLPVINVTPMMRNGKVVFPSGKYRLGKDINGADRTTTVPMGVVIEGLTQVSNLANPYNRDNGSIIIPLNTTGACLKFQGEFLKGSGSGLRNIKFTNGGGAASDCVVLDDVFYMNIDNCVFEHMDVGNCILLKSSTGNSCNWINIRNVFIKNVGDYNTLHTYGRGIYLLDCSDTNIIDPIIESCGSNGISMGGKNCKVIGGFIDLNLAVIGVYGSDNSIIATSTKLNFRSGIQLGAGANRTQLIGVRSIDNNASGNVQNILGYAIEISADINDLQIVGGMLGMVTSSWVQNGSINLYTSNIQGSISGVEFVGAQGTNGEIYDPNNLIGNKVKFHTPDHPAVSNGTTASRPTNPINAQIYCDTTLGKLIWYNKAGLNWKDAMGNVV